MYKRQVCDLNPFGPVALMAAYNESEDWVDELCQYIKGNHDALTAYVHDALPQLKVMPMEGTYLAWVDVRALGMTSDAVAELLLSKGHVHVSSGTLYGSAGEGFIRINLACRRALLMEGLERIRKVMMSET